MRLEVLPVEFQQAGALIEELESAGFEAYFVGGSVRDALLGKRIHDVDIATSAYPEEVKEIFKRTIDVGIEHGTVLVLQGDEHYEITTFRTESAYQDYRRPDDVTFVRSLTEDLKRRDFTINALAMGTDGNVIDLFQGIADLENGLIKAVGDASERFNEDALRMMRALRFASQLGFEIEADTYQAIVAHHRLLGKISIERIQIEFVKLMLGEHRRKGLIPFSTSGCYEFCPGFSGKATELMTLIELPNKPMTSEAMVWLVTLFILNTPESELRHQLSQWKLSNQLSKLVSGAMTGLRYRVNHSWTKEWLYLLGPEKLSLIEETLPYLNIKSMKELTLRAYEALPIHSIKELAVNGQELLKMSGQSPGPWVGQLLSQLETAVVTGEIENTQSRLLAYAQQVLAKNN